MEHSKGKLGRKEEAAFYLHWLFVYPFGGKSVEDALSPSGRPVGFSCSPEILNEKCVEFSSELNDTIGRSLQ